MVAGVKDAGPASSWYESVNANAFAVMAENVWVESERLREYPAANITEARALASGTLSDAVSDLSEVWDAVKLTAVPGVDNTYIALKTPGDFSSGALGNWILPQLVSRTNGLPSTGYAVRLYDGDPGAGGTEVSTTEGSTGTGINKTVAWFFDFASGLLLVSDTSSLFTTDPYINGFVYTGLTVADLPTTVSGGGDCNFPYEFSADCPDTVVLDDLVYVTGPSAGGVIQVDTVDITDKSTMPAIGIVAEKITTTRIRVITLGEVAPSMALTPGQSYFVGGSGKPVVSGGMPVPSVGGRVCWQPIGYALDTHVLVMMPNLRPAVKRG